MLTVILEVVLATLLTNYFYLRERPKIQFLLLGYLFFFVSLLIQLPFRLLDFSIEQLFSITIPFVIPLIVVALGEITKYFSLKRFLRTKSYKNAIFFGIGWSTLESISYFSMIFYSTLLSLVSLNLPIEKLLSQNLPLTEFVYFFLVNLGSTILVIFAIIKKKLTYLNYSILFSSIIYLGLYFLAGDLEFFFIILSIIYSLFLIFKYKKLI